MSTWMCDGLAGYRITAEPLPDDAALREAIEEAGVRVRRLAPGTVRRHFR